MILAIVALTLGFAAGFWIGLLVNVDVGEDNE